jgi:hypothetical protein
MTKESPRDHNRKAGPAEENELELITRDQACI